MKNYRKLGLYPSWYATGVDIRNSYKVFWNSELINEIYKDSRCKRSKFSLYLEWFIHTLCYKLGIQKDRAKDAFLEWDKSWFKNFFKSI